MVKTLDFFPNPHICTYRNDFNNGKRAFLIRLIQWQSQIETVKYPMF
jgi:hypothetical protein